MKLRDSIVARSPSDDVANEMRSRRRMREDRAIVFRPGVSMSRHGRTQLGIDKSLLILQFSNSKIVTIA